MTNSLERIFDSVLKALEAEVLPRLDDEFARGQLHGAIELLGNLKTRVEWSTARLHAEAAARLELASEVERLLGDARSLAPARPEAALDQPRVSSAELEAIRERLDHWLGEVLRFVAAHRGDLGGRAAEVEAAIVAILRAELKAEVKLTPPPRFGEISRGK
ncbi:MAG: hypothetical protein QOD06_263 [Candidatus Binatota bacterium]|nr:hypothetical protein [Candidatus Binatota bacterium]